MCILVCHVTHAERDLLCARHVQLMIYSYTHTHKSYNTGVCIIHKFISVFVAEVYISEMMGPGPHSAILGLQLNCHTFHSFALCSTGCCVRVCVFVLLAQRLCVVRALLCV